MSKERWVPALFVVGAVLAACQPAAPPPEPAPDPVAVKAAQVERGRYLVTVGVCNDCHTPKVMTDKGPALDTSRLLSGHPAAEAPPPVPAGVLSASGWSAMSNAGLTAWTGPWGVSFTRNLTPDQATGLGSWTEEMFIKTIRNGKHQGEGRDLLPPMPWPMYAQATDDDLKAMWAYLQSIAPIENAVPEPLPPAGPPPGAPAE
jgi:mono/diheme cytochrome c family protein